MRRVRSYVSTPLRLLQRVRELKTLLTFHRTRSPNEAIQLIESVREQVARIESLLGGPLRQRKILEIGPGQLLKRARVLAVDNHVTGIDLDDLPGDGLRGFLRIWNVNGPVRALKTLGRRTLGIDRQFLDNLHKAIPESRNVSIDFFCCDATQTNLSAQSFDVTMSTSVLEHISDPRAVLEEMIRVTRPQGVFFHIVHLYTSDTGAHDPRSFLGEHSEFPYWAHLRPEFKCLSTPNCYVNRWRLQEWIELFEDVMPGVQIERIPSEPSPAIVRALEEVRSNGLLQEYSDVELTTDCLIIAWKKSN